MAAQNYKIIVWERLNKKGKWCPYSPEISQFLEENYRKDVISVCLRDVDEVLKIYSVHFKDMLQISEVTGTKSPIRRSLYDSLCALGRGFSWQWNDEQDWTTYEVDVNDFIDCAFLEGKKSISLSKEFPGNHYVIDFSKMIQVNRHSKRKRKVRRAANASPYPVQAVSDDIMDTEGQTPTCPPCEVAPKVLNPEFLAQDIPGTTALLHQVNSYIRNVGSPEYNNLSHNQDDMGNLNHAALPNLQNSVRQEDKVSHLDQSIPESVTTVALVNGKPWTDSRPPHTPKSKIKPVPGIEPLPKIATTKRTKGKKRKSAPQSYPEEASLLEKYTEVINLASGCEETCIICCELLSNASSYNDDKTVLKLTLCSHTFHKACIEAMYESVNKEFLQCPSCKRIHGEKCGIQPPGEMIYHVLPYALPGYPENDTIRIIYDFHSGVQGPEHPNPGRTYSTRGFPRHCYLPDNEMGRKILRLLIKAWKRRLIFTIGRSATTGEENTVTWNEIHHKTEFGCNRRGHGYPDPNYFSNVLAELEAHGVTDDEVRVWTPA